MLRDTGLNEALADDRLNLDQVVNKVFVRLRTWARRAQIMPHYGLMCRSLRIQHSSPSMRPDVRRAPLMSTRGSPTLWRSRAL
eukprot:4652209-Pleurochrysis_carterae.AAC.1